MLQKINYYHSSRAEEKRTFGKEFQIPSSFHRTKALKTSRNVLKRAVARAKNDWISTNCKAVNSACASRGGTKSFWDNVKKLKGSDHSEKNTFEF